LNRRHGLWNRLSAAGLVLTLLAGCDYSPPVSHEGTGGTFKPGIIPNRPPRPGASNLPKGPLRTRPPEERNAILDSAITLIKRAALQPGGAHFAQAVQKLNQYFEGRDLAEYQLDSAAREYLGTQLSPDFLKNLEKSEWDSQRDTRHIEDCMMYYGIANRVAGAGQSLDRVRRVFSWVVQQVQLVPAGTLGAGQLGQAYARPYDVLLRGMATEAEGIWAERAWLFMAMCRQLEIDSGLLTYTKGNSIEPIVMRVGASGEVDSTAPRPRRSQKPLVIWICAVLIDERVYLFDARLGLEIPGPGGQGVATLADALSDPSILERMNLPGELPYTASQAALLSSPTKIGVLIDSSSSYFSPKMRMLERELPGKNRTILYRHPAEQRDHFTHVLAPHNGSVTLWPLPLEVETRLFTDARFVNSIQNSLFFFRPGFPLVYARVKQLRGELDEAIQDYVKLRVADQIPVVTDKTKKQMIPREIQDGLEMYATYYLALAQLERNHLDLAEQMFRRTLELLPEPSPSQPFYNMFRWGANANLGRIHETWNNRRAAIGYYTQVDPTSQHSGNLLRARELVWSDPMAPVPDPLPAAPEPKK
jgi:hypothetical protein